MVLDDGMWAFVYVCVLSWLWFFEYRMGEWWHARSQGGVVPRCVRCAYDVTGLPAGTTRCPECGETLDDTGVLLSGERVPKRLLANAHASRTVLLLLLVVSLIVLVPSCPPFGTKHVASRVVRIDAPSAPGAFIRVERRTLYPAYYEHGSMPLRGTPHSGWWSQRTYTARVDGGGIGPLRLEPSIDRSAIEAWVARASPSLNASDRERVAHGIGVYVRDLGAAWGDIEPPETTCVTNTLNGLDRDASMQPLVGLLAAFGRPSLATTRWRHGLHIVLYVLTYTPMLWGIVIVVRRAKRRYDAGLEALQATAHAQITV